MTKLLLTLGCAPVTIEHIVSISFCFLLQIQFVKMKIISGLALLLFVSVVKINAGKLLPLEVSLDYTNLPAKGKSKKKPSGWDRIYDFL